MTKSAAFPTLRTPPGRVIVPSRPRRHRPDGMEGVHSHGHRLPQQNVHMALHQVRRPQVIAHQEAFVGLGERHQVAHVLFRAALPDHHPHPQVELLLRLVGGEAFMVGLDAGIDVLDQVIPDQPGAVAVDRFPERMGDLDLAHHLRFLVDHAPVVHDLAQAPRTVSYPAISLPAPHRSWRRQSRTGWRGRRMGRCRRSAAEPTQSPGPCIGCLPCPSRWRSRAGRRR